MTTTRDIFTSQPAAGAVLRDWTHRTLTVDITNSMDEHFHFEIQPGERSDKLPSAQSAARPDDKNGHFLLATMPIVKA
jgi:hypothetical protein